MLSRPEVLRILFAADVLEQLGDSERARGLYQKADPSGKCPERLVSAFLGCSGYGEALFLEMEAARKGDMSALRSALNRLFLGESTRRGDPSLALELYETAKKANPKGSLPGEAEIVEFLKMAVAAGPFDLQAFLTQHHLSEEEPYFLWKLAEEASVGGRFGKPDPQLVLQLVVRAAGNLSECLSAARAAHTNWANKGDTKFEYRAHLSPEVTAELAKKSEAEKQDRGLDLEAREQRFESEFKRLEAVFKNPRVLEVDLRDVSGVICSEDGKLRIASWDTDTGGTMHLYCSMAQFKSPNGRAGYALLDHPDQIDGGGETKSVIFGQVSKIDTIVTNSKDTVYLVWTAGRASSRAFSECVTAFTLKNAKIERFPFFKTKRELLSEIQFGWNDSGDEERPAFKYSQSNGYTLLVPIISDRGDFSGKHFKYVFDGKQFAYGGVQ